MRSPLRHSTGNPQQQCPGPIRHRLIQHGRRVRHHDPLSEAFVVAAAEVGIPTNPDFNGATQEGARRLESVGFTAKLTNDGLSYRFVRGDDIVDVLAPAPKFTHFPT